DVGGVMARSALAIDGVDIERTATRRNTRQQVSVILIDEVTGERSVLWQRVPELVVGVDEIQREALTRGRILLMDAVDLPAAVRAATWAREAGVVTVLDIDTPSPGINDLLALTDVLIVGAEFPERLTGIGDLRAALRATAKRGPWFTAVTLGPGGALAVVQGDLHYVEAYCVPVVDSTGAGDLFHAGCIYGLLQGWMTNETLRFAAAAAALKCRKLGGRPGIPTAAEAATLAQVA
ncbi:MAG TPA: PfkB family carbohydrate kinase, partial [Candidatus Acidoferrales bacterium]|nr:PfkB family carbohydrate kinase [Candidatus Acidoferrales bacterium]